MRPNHESPQSFLPDNYQEYLAGRTGQELKIPAEVYMHYFNGNHLLASTSLSLIEKKLESIRDESHGFKQAIDDLKTAKQALEAASVVANDAFSVIKKLQSQ